MAFAVVSQLNLLYSERSEGLPPDQRARLGLAQTASGLDGAAKAFGQWTTPQFSFVATTTTAADTGSFTLNMATSTRSVVDPLSSPTLQSTITLGPLAGILTAGVIRPVRVRVKQFTSNTAAQIWWFQATVLGGATPVVFAPVANTAASSQLGVKRAVDDQVVFTAAAGSLVVTVTHGTGNANITWTIDVFTDDPV